MKYGDDYWVNMTRPTTLKGIDPNENSKRILRDASVVVEHYHLPSVEQNSKIHVSTIYLTTNTCLDFDIPRHMK